MKKVFAILLASLTLTSSINVIAKNQISHNISKNNGDDRDVKNFNGVAAAGPINVIVTLGNIESCRLEGDACPANGLAQHGHSGVPLFRHVLGEPGAQGK